MRKFKSSFTTFRYVELLPAKKTLRLVPLLFLIIGFQELFSAKTLPSVLACPVYYNYIPKLKPQPYDKLALPYQKSFERNPVLYEKMMFVNNSLFSEINEFVFVPLLVLTFLLITAIAIIIERTQFYFRATHRSEEFVYQFKEALQNHHQIDAFTLTVDCNQYPVAKITQNIFRVIQTLDTDRQDFFERCSDTRCRAIEQCDAELRERLRILQLISRCAFVIGIIGTTMNLIFTAKASFSNFVFVPAPEVFSSVLFGIVVSIISYLANKRFSLLAKQISLEAYKSSWETFDCLINYKMLSKSTPKIPIQLSFDY